MHIFIGTAPNIAGTTVRGTLLAHSRQCPCSRHDLHPHQCLHNPLEAALTAEEALERNVNIRHVSREIIGRDQPRQMDGRREVMRGDRGHRARRELLPSKSQHPGIEDTNNAYNALNSALAANFNTIYALRRGNKVSSAENRSPDLQRHD